MLKRLRNQHCFVHFGICTNALSPSRHNPPPLTPPKLPGLFHAWYIIAKYPDHIVDYAPIDQEAHIHPAYSQQQRRHQQHQPPRQDRPVYGQPPPPSGEGYGSFNVTPASAPHGGAHQHAGAGSGGPGQGAPPSYASVVKGDNKVQR